MFLQFPAKEKKFPKHFFTISCAGFCPFHAVEKNFLRRKFCPAEQLRKPCFRNRLSVTDSDQLCFDTRPLQRGKPVR